MSHTRLFLFCDRSRCARACAFAKLNQLKLINWINFAGEYLPRTHEPFPRILASDDCTRETLVSIHELSDCIHESFVRALKPRRRIHETFIREHEPCVRIHEPCLRLLESGWLVVELRQFVLEFSKYKDETARF